MVQNVRWHVRHTIGTITITRHWEQIIDDCKAPGTELNKLCVKELYGLLVDKGSIDNNVFCVAWLTYGWVWFDCCETIKLVFVEASATCDAKNFERRI